MSANCLDLSPSLKKARLTLLVAASLAAMVALMIPGPQAESDTLEKQERSTGRKVRTRVEPQYPDLARRLGITGPVRLKVHVDRLGTVRDVRAVSGDHLLTEAAEDAVRQWKFVSAPSESTLDIDLDFSLAA